MKTNNCVAAAPAAERQALRLPYKSMPVPVPIVDMSKPFRRSRFCLHGFNLTISRWSIGDERFKQMMRGVCDFIHCTIECRFVGVRRFGKSGQFPNKLQ